MGRSFPDGRLSTIDYRLTDPYLDPPGPCDARYSEQSVRQSQYHRKRPLHVLFVCVENSCRSQMAEAFARMHGGDRIEPYSAGSHASGRVHLRVIDLMREVGYAMEGHRSKGLTEIPNWEFDLIVTMGCGEVCSGVPARRREEWDLPCPKEMPAHQFRAVRDRIEEKVMEVLASI